MRPSVFTGYIQIPSDMDREEYVAYALQTMTVCVRTGDGDFIKDCPVSYGFMGVNDGFAYALRFPQDKNSLGSQVVCICPPEADIPIVVGCLAMLDGNFDLKEESLKMSRTPGDTGFIIEGDGLQGILNMVVEGGEDGEGAISLTARNNARTAMIRLATDVFKFEASKRFEVLSNEEFEVIVKNATQDKKKASIKYVKGIGLVYKDEWDNEILTEEGKVYMKEGGSGKVFEIEEGELSVGSEGGSDEAMAMGDSLKDKLEALIDAISQLTVPTPSGTSGTPVNIADFQQIKSELQEILSEIATVDRS